MRTDAKVGLIAVFVLVLLLVGYFAWSRKPAELPLPHTETSLTPATAPAPDDSLRLTPLGTPIASTVPATTIPVLGGPVILTPPGTTLPATFDTGPALTHILPPPTSNSWDAPPTTAVTTRPRLSEGPSLVEPRIDILPPLTPPTDVSTSSDAGSTHIIKAGDTFGKLAKQYKVSVKAITAANPHADSSHLKIGQKIIIPAAATSVVTPPVSPTTSPATRPTRSSRTTTSTTTRPAHAAPGTSYTVKSGDNLRKIAKEVYGDEKMWERIARVNRAKLGSNPDDLKVGMTLELPAR